MVRSDPPEFVSTTEAVWLVPTGTFPKLMLAGATASCPALEAPEKDQAAAGLAKLGSVKKEKRRRTEIVWERTPPVAESRLARYHLVTPCFGLQNGGIFVPLQPQLGLISDV
jgi:hypothetical protein